MKNFILLSVLMVFGVAMFSGCASMTGRTAGEHIDDASITAEANEIIVKDQDAQFLKINVTTTNGNVVMSGYIHDKVAEERITSKIWQIKGVKSVKSTLQMEQKK
ncbi:MAG: BON domain-containing protein [Thermodesulfovibrionia bacterium]|nr:BON domain-containing protein [Thermodesulfovibrionia bacterium]